MIVQLETIHANGRVELVKCQILDLDRPVRVLIVILGHLGRHVPTAITSHKIVITLHLEQIRAIANGSVIPTFTEMDLNAQVAQETVVMANTYQDVVEIVQVHVQIVPTSLPTQIILLKILHL